MVAIYHSNWYTKRLNNIEIDEKECWAVKFLDLKTPSYSPDKGKFNIPFCKIRDSLLSLLSILLFWIVTFLWPYYMVSTLFSWFILHVLINIIIIFRTFYKIKIKNKTKLVKSLKNIIHKGCDLAIIVDSLCQVFFAKT